MKNLRLTTLLVALALAGCSGSGSTPVAKSVEQSWCVQWQHIGESPNEPAVPDNQRFMFHLGYFLSKSDRVREHMKEQTKFDDQTLDSIQQCYEENTPRLVGVLDQACADQANDEEVKNIINGYYNWCIKQKQKTA